MNTLSKEAEQQMIDAIKTAVDYVDHKGMTPDAAMQKIAESHRWGRDMLKLAAAAYNTGRQTAQREVNDNVLDKLATFELVDPDKVAEAMWPSEVKSAADIFAATAVSDEYNRAPGWLDQQGRERQLKKLAEAPWFTDIKTPEPYAKDPAEKMAHVYNIHRDHVRSVEEARMQASVSRERVHAAVGQLSGYFKQASYNRLPFSDVEHFAVSRYGDAGKALMDVVHQRNRLKEARASAANLPKTALAIDKAPFTLVTECINRGRTVHEKQAAYIAAQQAHDKQAEDLRPFVGGPAVQATTESRYLLPEKPMAKKAGGFFGGLLGGSIGANTQSMLGKALADQPTDADAIGSQIGKLDDPAHQAELDKIRTQAMLADFMNDDVIGGYDPAQVMQAYNEVSQMAPRSAAQPLVMRSLLRRQLQGHVEPFEAKEISDIEKGLISAREPSYNLFGN